MAFYAELYNPEFKASFSSTPKNTRKCIWDMLFGIFFLLLFQRNPLASSDLSRDHAVGRPCPIEQPDKSLKYIRSPGYPAGAKVGGNCKYE